MRGKSLIYGPPSVSAEEATITNRVLFPLWKRGGSGKEGLKKRGILEYMGTVGKRDCGKGGLLKGRLYKQVTLETGDSRNR